MVSNHKELPFLAHEIPKRAIGWPGSSSQFIDDYQNKIESGHPLCHKKANSKYCELDFQGLHFTIIYYI